MGANLATVFSAAGCKVVAVSDSQGGVYNGNGLKVPNLRRHKQSQGSVLGFPGGQEIGGEDLLGVECDLLMPAALAHAIHRDNAKEVGAWMIAEAANGPLTPEADRALDERGVLVLPDILCNAGGVTVSYFEWVQGLQYYFWGLEEVTTQLRDVMLRAYRMTERVSREEDISLRQAAYTIALQRLEKAYRFRGIFP